MNHQRLNYYLRCIETIKGGADARMDWATLYKLLDELTEGQPMVIKPVNTTSVFGRARLLPSEQRFETIDSLWHPDPAACNAVGRCNKAHAPMLYAGVGTQLLLSEIGAQVGDIVGLLHLQPTEEIRIVEIGAMDRWRRTDGDCQLDHHIKQYLKGVHSNPDNIVAFLMDAFASDYFSRPGTPTVYKVTSAYASVMARAHPTIGGLMYDSVDHRGGTCLAVKPEVAMKSLAPHVVQIVRVTAILGYGIYDFHEVARAMDFNGREIKWP